MFWRFGGYASISTIDTILDKPDFTLEELLDESDLIQELKQHNTKLIEYLREDKILEKLLEYVVAPKLEVVEAPDDPVDDEAKGKIRLLPFTRPRASSRATDATDNDEDEQERRRNCYALVACEILSSDTWSIYEALTENRELVRNFWAFLARPAPLDPLQASYFTKVNESLFEKKTEEMMELLRSLPNVVSDLLKHVESPMVMDLLLKVIALDRTEGGQGIVEWLYSEDIIPALLSCLDPKRSWVVQTAAGDFIKAIITISANASQNEQQCIGPNELTRQLVSKPCVEQLIGYMLGGGNPLTVGVGIVIEVIRKNNSDYDPDVGTESNTIPSSRDPIYLGTLLRRFADNVPTFMGLIMDGPSRKQGLASTFGEKLEPLGFDRFKTCELMAELLHCSNMGLLNEVGSEQLISARDAERTRLRTEGKLGPERDEDHSADDLTMRAPHAPLEDGRRLEVTNADEDGFEEVEPSKEMSEDTSHEFVKAEDDIAAPPPGSFLEKDEDDFVDEPLSSPRLSVGADRINEQQFEDPDLVVAPLSPSKVNPTDRGPTKAPDSQDAAARSQSGASEKPTIKVTDSQPKSEETAAVVPAAAAEPEVKDETTGLAPRDAADSAQHHDLSPHPEDTPAPLFSIPSAPQPGSEQPLAGNTAVTLSDPPNSHAAENRTGIAQEGSIHEQSVSEPQKEGAGSTEPVVGDYLKMQFVEHGVVPAILSFFFSYPWNNFLHNVVYDIVQQVFNGPMERGYNPTLAVSLFEAADVTTAIINGQQASDVSQATTKTRMGYMGHLTLIAEEVVKFTERHPPELLSEMVLDKVMSQEWINYVEGALAETRERDNAILGGVRPEVALGHRGGIGGNGLGGVGMSCLGASGNPSNALAEAGLNGGIELNEGGGNGIGPFAISAGTLMSGFGSSSDEEDEEGDGDEEDVNSEVSGDCSDEQGMDSLEATGTADSPVDFRAYTDSLNDPGNSMAPPSIPPPPPPPPPLNIPPSRARLQLAARLAMHQKNNLAAQPSSATMHHDDDDDEDNVDPFRDGEDDIDDDDAEGDAPHERVRGSWWRGVVRSRGKASGDDSDDADDDEDEFGDFAMAEDDKGGPGADGSDGPNVVLRPLAVHPAKESSRGLSGLWPFGSRSDKDKNKHEGDKDELKDEVVVPAVSEKREDDKQAVEVKEAASRTSIEEPDDEEVVAGAEGVAGGTSR
ncbi:Extragenic suppressor of kinetochore protein 1 [Tolypocladium capitatum]|uniref:Extragenic suppressor of kinetochore protein 1 n=1 Tax=Tolypocladium capitatum TaxID=45235 RepID=A0A2K3QBZ6_9HYPO|nr:Extragenic suppressor of kinetochore protein 1 [Tolypocladium capitatum]